MAENLTPLDGLVYLDNLQNDAPWSPFEMEFIEDFCEVSAREPCPSHHPVSSPIIGTVDGNVPRNGSVTSIDAEQNWAAKNGPLNDADGTAVISSHIFPALFADDLPDGCLNLENHELSSKEAATQTHLGKLEEPYCHNDPLDAVQLQRQSFTRNPERHSHQAGVPKNLFETSRRQISPLATQWKPGLTAEELNDGVSDANKPPSLVTDDAAMDIDATSGVLSVGSQPIDIPHAQFEDSARHEVESLNWKDIWGSPLTQQYFDEQDSSQPSSRPTARRSSWDGLSRTLKEVGACWRCKILRKKCDPDQPCKACPRSNSRWQGIGCKRGTLLDHIPYISLCPKTTAPGRSSVSGAANTTRHTSKTAEDYRLELCLNDALSRLDGISTSTNDTYTKIVLEILCSPLALSTDTPLSLRRDVEGNTIHIAWGLVDVPSAKDILHIRSLEHTFDVIKAAVTYEMEYGHSQAVPIAIDCLRSCVEILRLRDGGHLTPNIHRNCMSTECQVQPFQDLSSKIKSFTDELSKVIFRKENRLHEKRWWLSAFYSLWLQSFVRRTVRFIEIESKAQLNPETKNACSAYLLLALELFDATSAAFDPLMTMWSLEDEPPNMDLRLMKYYRLAQKALFSEQLAYDTCSSIDYLRRLYGDIDTPSTLHTGETMVSPSIWGVGNDTQSRDTFNPKPPILQPYRQPSSGKFSVPLRTGSGAKRRAGSPLEDSGLIQRNGSSSSILDGRELHSRGISIASPRSPISSAYSFAYGTSHSTRWDSGDSLAEMAKLLGTSPPNHREQFSYLSPSREHRPSLHYKSSNESFLELPRNLSKRRPATSAAKDSLRGRFLCECCPKKPKKFDTVEELSAHEAERRYECGYCGNRFKSKNEAERHENSIHVRRHAWSCSNMQSIGYMNLFQESINRPGVADTCGYCGEDFPRSGGGEANENDWDERLNHIREVHKFGECNSVKRFFRADHFRQHLKHSHGATLGRWIGVLETASMIDVPEPMRPSSIGDVQIYPLI
ncbi:hypothetical protein F5Y04DRAFT_233782 [Hypomontagnella monticulosa]|nr:hypothetical protein F5Y04DRAFT_233782 [Hypomontagnella monticulosa]